MQGEVVARVERSKAKDFSEGAIVRSSIGWQEWGIIPAHLAKPVDLSLGPISTALGVLGMPGLTAYFGLQEICQPKAGDTLVVSAASGAVGAVVGQLAKMKSCRAVGIAGTDEKCRYVVEELGFDAAINYRTEDLAAALAKACPNGIDVYFDNVGGPVLDAVMAQISSGARIALCGSIAEYNEPTGQRQGPSLNRIAQGGLARIEGFNQGQYQDRHEEALALLAIWVRSGKLKYKEDIVVGLEKAPEAFIGMMQGRNFGKLLIQVREDPTQDS